MGGLCFGVLGLVGLGMNSIEGMRLWWSKEDEDFADDLEGDEEEAMG